MFISILNPACLGADWRWAAGGAASAQHDAPARAPVPQPHAGPTDAATATTAAAAATIAARTAATELAAYSNAGMATFFFFGIEFCLE